MFQDRLNQSFLVTRTSTVINPTTHIASTVTQTFGPFKCRTARVRTDGNSTQGQPQVTYTQLLRLYTSLDSNVKVGDIVTIENAKYTASNFYKAHGHHLEIDIVYKSEV